MRPLSFETMKALVPPFLLLALASSCLSVPSVYGQDPLAGDGAETDDLDIEAELEGGGITGLRGEERAKVIEGIFANPKPDHFRDLCHVLKADLDKRETEDKAFRILLGFGGEQLVPVGKALVGHAILYKRLMGIRLLAASRSRKAVPVLLELAGSKNSEDASVSYRLACALADLGDARSLPWLKEKAKTEAFARLALCTLRDFSALADALRDHDRIQGDLRQLLHNMRVQAPYWSPAQKRSAAQHADKLRDYVRRFRGLFALFGPEQMRIVTSYLRETPGSALPDILYVELTRLVNADNGESFLSLLEVPNAALQEEAACVLADLQDAKLLEKLREALAQKAQSESIHDRAVAMRLVGLFPGQTRVGILRGGVSDRSAYVVVEALEAALGSAVVGLADELAKVVSGPRWRSEARIQRLAGEARWMERRSLNATARREHLP